MTAEEKLEEAYYNLDKVRHLPFLQHTFKFELSNFLSSSQSILWHLIEDYNIKFGLGLSGKYSIENFKQKAKDTKNETALKFIQWFADEYNKLQQNHEYGFLVEKRHLNVHQKSVMPTKSILSDYTPRTFQAGTTTEIPINFDMAESVFDENPKANLRLICIKFLEHIRKIVQDAHRLFP